MCRINFNLEPTDGMCGISIDIIDIDTDMTISLAKVSRYI